MKPILIALAALSANNALAGVTPVMATQTPTTFSYATDSLYLPQNAGAEPPARWSHHPVGDGSGTVPGLVRRSRRMTEPAVYLSLRDLFGQPLFEAFQALATAK